MTELPGILYIFSAEHTQENALELVSNCTLYNKRFKQQYSMHSLLSFVLCAVFHASLVIAFSPTRHFSYSSAILSSMYILMLDLACCFRIYRSLLTIPLISGVFEMVYQNRLEQMV